MYFNKKLFNVFLGLCIYFFQKNLTVQIFQVRQLVYTVFISNNRTSFHLWWNENLVKHQKVSKYHKTDCTLQPMNLPRFPSFSVPNPWSHISLKIRKQQQSKPKTQFNMHVFFFFLSLTIKTALHKDFLTISINFLTHVPKKTSLSACIKGYLSVNP